MKFDLAVLDAVRRLMDTGFIDVNLACPYLPPDEVYSEEVIDAYALLNDKERKEAFPFFDEEFYLSQLDRPPTTSTNLLEHFLHHGVEYLLAPHPLIRPAGMVQSRSDLLGTPLTLGQFVSALVGDWCDPSPFLWLTWYRVAAKLDESEGALWHYLRRGAALNLPPNPYFEPSVYAEASPDAPQHGLALVRHFVMNGDQALTPSGARFDAEWYSAKYPDAKCDTHGPLWYFLSIGRHIGHAPSNKAPGSTGKRRLSAATNDVSRTESPQVSNDRYDDLMSKIARDRRLRLEQFPETRICPIEISDHFEALSQLEFPIVENPDVDVLIPVYNEFEVTVECLVALRSASTRRRIRVVVADDASRDERIKLLDEVPGLTVLRNAKNLHFLRSCNSAFDHLSAPYLFLLNNDTQVFDGAIDRLIDRIESAPDNGAAAPMLLYPNGRLQEAGCTIRHDGESTMVGVGDDPDKPCYNYPREIEYGSGAGLMIRRDALDGRLFDDRFAPAYCEDADLCLTLRDCGWRVVYEPTARIAHHLSVSTSRTSERRRIQLARLNQQKLSEKWATKLRRDNQARVLAFYLPQFHPIERNNVWWGKGFTEWTNVSRALPSFEGHYQPHLPADLGFYDLRRVETLDEQQALAHRYGVEGFIVYYYNFGAARVLEQPMEALLKRPDIEFRFALCWANENWTRHWDGGQRAMLLEQQYDEATLDSVADDFLRFAMDERAIRVNGKPLAMIYRPLLIPDVAQVAERFRRRFRAAGLGEIHLVYVESMEALEKHVRPSDIGFDACVEFPPQGIAEPYARPIEILKAGWQGKLYDYVATVRNAVLRPQPDYVRYPAVMPSWDNTARQPLKGTTLVGAEPELFQAYVENKLDELFDFKVSQDRLLFVNAWNEWAEGAHLEPDRAYGHRWLAAIRNALLAKGMAR